ncbi:MAG: hypothetical protein ABIV39_01460, partial [Verrucomicrobiota bacterium]
MRATVIVISAKRVKDPAALIVSPLRGLPMPHTLRRSNPIVIRRAAEGVQFVRVGLASNPHSPAPTGLADVGEGAFASPAAPPVQSFAFVAAHPPPVGPEVFFVCFRFIDPHPVLDFLFRDVGADA